MTTDKIKAMAFRPEDHGPDSTAWGRFGYNLRRYVRANIGQVLCFDHNGQFQELREPGFVPGYGTGLQVMDDGRLREIVFAIYHPETKSWLVAIDPTISWSEADYARTYVYGRQGAEVLASRLREVTPGRVEIVPIPKPDAPRG